MNSVRFERPHKSFSAPTVNVEVPKRSSAPQHSNTRLGSYANVVNEHGTSGSYGSAVRASSILNGTDVPLPALVLDDSCVSLVIFHVML